MRSYYSSQARRGLHLGSGRAKARFEANGVCVSCSDVSQLHRFVGSPFPNVSSENPRIFVGLDEDGIKCRNDRPMY